MSTTLLAFDTSGQHCSVALSVGGELCSEHVYAPRQQTAKLLPMIDRLLAGAGIGRAALDGIAFGRGPGSFVGVRLATSAAQGLGFALDKPLLPISSLQAVAEFARENHNIQKVIPCLDARMAEVYWSAVVYKEGVWHEVLPEQVTPAEGLLAANLDDSWALVGPGIEAYPMLAAADLWIQHPDIVPHAVAIARLGAQAFARGEAVPAREAHPVYLRNQVIR